MDKPFSDYLGEYRSLADTAANEFRDTAYEAAAIDDFFAEQRTFDLLCKPRPKRDALHAYLESLPASVLLSIYALMGTMTDLREGLFDTVDEEQMVHPPIGPIDPFEYLPKMLERMDADLRGQICDQLCDGSQAKTYLDDALKLVGKEKLEEFHQKVAAAYPNAA